MLHHQAEARAPFSRHATCAGADQPAFEAPFSEPYAAHERFQESAWAKNANEAHKR